MAPALSVLADGGDHSVAELRAVLAERLDLTEDDLRAKTPSGTPLLADRLSWAVTYMYQAGLLSRPKRLPNKLRSSPGPVHRLSEVEHL